ncbi:MAG: hypothetical protein IPK62_01990 [Bacteroidetes bacterium]|nr:hypothetical protein [Bacteroidota bacterium]
MRKILFATGLLFLLSQHLFAQIFADPTTWSFKTKKISEGEYELLINCKLKPEWHLWSLNPGGDGMLVSPAFTFSKNKDIEIVGKIKESGKKISKEFPGTDGITHYYENEINYSQKFKAKANTVFKGSVRYQSCDHGQCLKPEEKPFEVKITDVAVVTVDTTETVAKVDTAVPLQVEAPDTPKVAAASNEIKPATEPAVEKVESSGNTYLLLSGLGYGLISVFTPCVFAMLPMTVSFFLKRSKDRKTGIKNALTYSLSIILIFTVLGALISFTLGGNALNAIATNWIVNIFFFLIFMIFGISFFRRL